jgi:NAD(P)-dependent dehydrogenase (short-subunit alcohol dehydrogenase family)
LYKISASEGPAGQARVAWVTGASSGIGAALCLGLAAGGWTVAASARRAERLQALAADERAAGRIHAVPLDVTDEPAVTEAVAAIEARLGPVHTAVLNAGDYTPMPARSFDTALFRRLMEVNYLGVVHGIGAVLPRQLARGQGRLFVTASVAGYRGLPLAAPYGATKAALINLAESLRAELDGSGVEVRLINPGFVRTDLTAKNAFHMPALVDAETAAARILRELDGTGFEIAFPRRFAYALKLLRMLPYRLYFPLIRRMTGT